MAKPASNPRARPDTWMPMFWGDYHKDTGHLNAAQHGFYLLLIGHYWSSGQPLPDDDAQLWRIARADSVAHWRKSRPIVGAFFNIGDGVWAHARVARELVLAVKRKKKAEHAASIRWADAQASPEHATEHCPSDALHNLSPSPPTSVTTNRSVANSARQQLLDETWEPTEDEREALRAETPWLVGELYARRMRDFRDWCTAQGTRTFNPAATWRGFMRKTKPPPEAQEDWNTRRIRLAREAIRS